MLDNTHRKQIGKHIHILATCWLTCCWCQCHCDNSVAWLAGRFVGRSGSTGQLAHISACGWCRVLSRRCLLAHALPKSNSQVYEQRESECTSSTTNTRPSTLCWLENGFNNLRQPERVSISHCLCFILSLQQRASKQLQSSRCLWPSKTLNKTGQPGPALAGQAMA